MTKIYKSIGTEGDEKDLEVWEEARRLFGKFRVNFENWVYKVLLPKADKGKEGPFHNTVKKEAWDALYTIGSLFPEQWNYKTDKHEPALWELKRVRDKNIVKYQRAFSKVFKTIDEFLNTNKDLDRLEDEKYDVSGMNVLVRGYGRNESDVEEEIGDYLRNLKRFVDPIIKAGYKEAVSGLQVRLSKKWLFPR